MSNTIPVSVLMTTYAGEKTANLSLSIESMMNQSVLAQEIIFIIDGPIDKEQYNILEYYKKRNIDTQFKIYRLDKNSGLAKALNYGIPLCSFDIIARMDSDDISRYDRLEKQYRFMNQHSDIDVVASWHEEFKDGNPSVITAIKKTPSNHLEIVNSLTWRNVISHPTLMIRKAVLLKINGYDESVGLLEDYDLHMRLIKSGAHYAAIQEPLVMVRISRLQRARRGGITYSIRELIFRYRCYKRGNYSLWLFLSSFIVNALFRLMPTYLKEILYRFVRSSVIK